MPVFLQRTKPHHQKLSSRHVEDIRRLRDKIANRDSWNFFVGDPTMVRSSSTLQFLSPLTEFAYSRFVVASGADSQRIILCLLFILALLEGMDFGVLHLLTLTSLFALSWWVQSKWTAKLGQSWIFIALLNLFPLYYGISAAWRGLAEHMSLDPDRGSGGIEANQGVESSTISTQSEESSGSFRQLEIVRELSTAELLAIALRANFPVVALNLLLAQSWISVAIPSAATTLFLLGSVRRTAGFSLTCGTAVVILQLVLVGTVAGIEKVKREYFILFTTSAKTKKQLLSFFNISQPCSFVSEEGTIRMFNEGFETFVLQSLGMTEIPASILQIQTSEGAQQDNLLSKIREACSSFHLGFPQDKQIVENLELQINDKNNKSSKKKAIHFQITLRPFKFENRKCAVMTFEDKSDTMLTQFLLGLQADLVSKKSENPQLSIMAESIHQFLGLTNSQASDPTSFNLLGYLEASMEVLTSFKDCQMRIRYPDLGTLPKMVKGDLKKLQFCFKTYAELLCSTMPNDSTPAELRVTQKDATITSCSIVLSGAGEMEARMFEDVFQAAATRSKPLLKLIQENLDQAQDFIKNKGLAPLILSEVIDSLGGKLEVKKTSESREATPFSVELVFPIGKEPALSDEIRVDLPSSIERSEVEGYVYFKKAMKEQASPQKVSHAAPSPISQGQLPVAPDLNSSSNESKRLLIAPGDAPKLNDTGPQVVHSKLQTGSMQSNSTTLGRSFPAIQGVNIRKSLQDYDSKHSSGGKIGDFNDTRKENPEEEIKQLTPSEMLKKPVTHHAAKDTSTSLNLPPENQMCGVITSREQAENLESEMRDQVDSLSNVNEVPSNKQSSSIVQLGDLKETLKLEPAGDEDIDQFNFQLEHIDSLMMESECSAFRHTSESGNTQKQNPKSRLLSKVVQRQIFDRFSTLDGASKNLLSSPGQGAANAPTKKMSIGKNGHLEVIQEKSVEESNVPQLMIRQSTLQSQTSYDH